MRWKFCAKLGIKSSKFAIIAKFAMVAKREKQGEFRYKSNLQVSNSAAQRHTARYHAMRLCFLVWFLSGLRLLASEL